MRRDHPVRRLRRARAAPGGTTTGFGSGPPPRPERVDASPSRTPLRPTERCDALPSRRPLLARCNRPRLDRPGPPPRPPRGRRAAAEGRERRGRLGPMSLQVTRRIASRTPSRHRGRRPPGGAADGVAGASHPPGYRSGDRTRDGRRPDRVPRTRTREGASRRLDGAVRDIHPCRVRDTGPTNHRRPRRITRTSGLRMHVPPTRMTSSTHVRTRRTMTPDAPDNSPHATPPVADAAADDPPSTTTTTNCPRVGGGARPP